MFWTNEDLDEVGSVVTEVFGKQGNMEPNAAYSNVVVWNKMYGKLWYGDVASLEDLKDKCVALASKLSKEICVSYMDTDNFFNMPKYVFSQI